jgi:hypothetical protein
MNLKHQSTLPSNLQAIPIIDLRTVLPVNPKYTWETLKGNRNPNALTTIVLHHDAWPKKVSAPYPDVALATKIAQDHINSKKNIPGGDGGFPYDAWIRNGNIYICNDMLPLKYGVSSNNTYTVHICVSGDYVNGDQLTEADHNALLAAIFIYRAIMPAFSAIKAHKELSPTACPGYDFNAIRDDIAAIDDMMMEPQQTAAAAEETEAAQEVPDLEQREYDQSLSATRVRAYAAAERVNELGVHYDDPRWNEAARIKLSWLSEVTGKSDPKEIVGRVVDLHNKAQAGNYQGEAIRKLLLIADVMKQQGLL